MAMNVFFLLLLFSFILLSLTSLPFTHSACSCPYAAYCGPDSCGITGSVSACRCGSGEGCGVGPYYQCRTCTSCPSCMGCSPSSPPPPPPTTTSRSSTAGASSPPPVNNNNNNPTPPNPNCHCTWAAYCGADSCGVIGPSSACQCMSGYQCMGAQENYQCRTAGPNSPPSTPPPSNTPPILRISSSASSSNTIPRPSSTASSSNIIRPTSSTASSTNLILLPSSSASSSPPPSLPHSSPLTSSKVDFVIQKLKLDQSLRIETVNFLASGCAFIEGVINQTGQRRLLRFTAQMHNLGTEDFVLGAPWDHPELFTWSACHAHYHLNGWAKYELFDSDNQLVGNGKKTGFCIRDTVRVNTNSRATQLYTCDNQGMSRNWGDVYDWTLDGQWIDITGLEAGVYRIRLTVNPDRRFFETNYDNNMIETQVTIT